MQTSVVNYKDLNFELRIDAEYYRAEVLKNIRLLDKKQNKLLSDLASFVMGPFGSTVTVDQYVSNSNFRYIRNKDINDFQISDDEQSYIPAKVFWALPQFHIKENDLLITVVGTLGKVAIATQKNVSSIFSCKSTIIRTKKIDPFYLLTYLNSNIGQLFALRGARGAIQQGLNLSDLKEIKVFLPSQDFQETIRAIVCNAFVFNTEARNLYAQAEKMLLSELGLLNWESKYNLSFIKNYSDTEQVSRIDAEYFQPKYDKIINAIKSYKKGFKKLESFIKNYSTGYPFKSESYTEDGIPLIRINNIKNGELDLSNAAKLPFTDISLSPKDVANENDILISMSGTIGNSCKIPLGIKALINQRIMRITPINSDFNVLPLLINSIIGKYQLERIGTGGVQTNISSSDIKEILIPRIETDQEKKISKLIEQSFNLKKQSKKMIEIAKRGVEIAIEKNENTAQNWIEEQLKIIA